MVAEEPTDRPVGGGAGLRTSRPPEQRHEVAGGDADWIAAQATERPVPAVRDEAAHARDRRGTTADPGVADAGTTADPLADPSSWAASPTARPAARRARRAGAAETQHERAQSRRPSVPSWDEIMFGGGKHD